MCGICGWFNTRRKIDFSILEKMNNVAAYRGPDDEGYVGISAKKISAFSGKDSCITGDCEIQDVPRDIYFGGFGHRRLSIIDLSPAGHQPMISEQGEYCVTYNGEIYNYLEIQEKLIKLGYSFHSKSDTEVLLKSYMEWGEQCVQHFNGMWAFAIWDRKRCRLFCSRDRLGAKPFYYYLDQENFLFSSEIKQLCQNDVVPRKVNEKNLAIQLIWGLSDFSEETFIEDIKELHGGDNLFVYFERQGNEFQLEKVAIEHYWDVDTHTDKDAGILADLFETHRDAVSIRTRSDVPIGILLSGGLDSSILTADVSGLFRARGIDTKQINTFTSCWENFVEGNEWGFADATNRYCGVTGHQIFPNSDNVFADYKSAIWHTEGLFGLNALGSFLMLKELSHYQIKVMLNGQGSDETMFGYERYYTWYLKDILKTGGLKPFIKSFRDAEKNSILSRKQLAEYFIYFNSYRIRKSYVLSRMRPIATKHLMNLAAAEDSVRKLVSFPSLQDLQYNELRRTQLTHILRYDDRMYMAFSIESRVPFIDYRYIEKACAVPEECKIQKGYTKYPLRKYIEGKLPDEVVWRKNKMGWPSPRKRWVDGLDSSKIEKMLKESRSTSFFDINKVKKLYNENPYALAMEKFLNIELLLRLFDVQM